MSEDDEPGREPLAHDAGFLIRAVDWRGQPVADAVVELRVGDTVAIAEKTAPLWTGTTGTDGLVRIYALEGTTWVRVTREPYGTSEDHRAYDDRPRPPSEWRLTLEPTGRIQGSIRATSAGADDAEVVAQAIDIGPGPRPRTRTPCSAAPEEEAASEVTVHVVGPDGAAGTGRVGLTLRCRDTLGRALPVLDPSASLECVHATQSATLVEGEVGPFHLPPGAEFYVEVEARTPPQADEGFGPFRVSRRAPATDPALRRTGGHPRRRARRRRRPRRRCGGRDLALLMDPESATPAFGADGCTWRSGAVSALTIGGPCQ